MVSNCWEVMACGREPGGENVESLGVCPAATETRLNGQNRGFRGGRACWVVAGTLCGGTVQGTFATKLTNCHACEFFRQVAREEKSDAASTADLRDLLK